MKMETKGEKEALSIVKFNVGGKVYDISMSLLKQFPGCLLAEKALSSTASSPIFIDRDPDRFAYCLDYMRDNGKVYLPETASKIAVLEELKFFGFTEIDATKILSDEKSQRNCVLRFNQITEAIKQQIAQMEKELEPLQRDVIKRKQEIGMQKVALRGRAKSVESTDNRFSVDYMDLKELDDIHKEQYFIDCCDKLGLCVVGRGNMVYGKVQDVILTRKHMDNTEQD